MLINSENLQIFFHGGKTEFNDAFRQAEVLYRDFAMVIRSSKQAEVHAWLGQFPQLKEWVGSRTIEKLRAEDYTIVNKDYESTVVLKKNDILADNMGVFAPLPRMLGATVAAHPDLLIADLIKQGNRQTCFDGQYFFDSDHPVDGVGNVSNLDGNNTSDVQWMLVADSMGIMPFVYQIWQPYEFRSLQSLMDTEYLMTLKEFHFGTDGSSAAGYGLWQLAYGSTNPINTTRFNTAYAAMRSFKGEGNRPLGIMPKKIICNPANRAAAKQVVQELVNQGESNPNANLVEVVENPYMA